jgi:Zn-finger nucleic acid-binding protein
MNGKTIREGMKQEGYSNEEKYFYELNQDLIRQQKVQLDLIRKNKNEQLCPRCESPLFISDLGGFNHLQCPQCKGVFMESSELETLMKDNQSNRLIQKMKTLFIPQQDYRLF